MTDTKRRDDFIQLADNERNVCFGCSSNNDSGLKMEFYTRKDRDLVVSWFSIPERFVGWSNLVHGGIVSTILDEAMGWGALVILRKLMVSKSMNVEFIKPVFVNSKIRVEGNVQEEKNEREAIMQGLIYNDVNELCARSTSNAALFTVEALRKLGFADEEMLSELERNMQ
jgi:acyl-coenzyme A thioesterase PaaI-like protein